MTMLWKLLAELSLYFSIISAIPFVFQISFNPVFIILLCVLAVSVSEPLCGCSHHSLRFTALLPALSPVCFIRSTLDAIIILPVVLYTAIVILTKMKRPDYYQALRLFKISCWVIVFVAILLLGTDYALQFTTDYQIGVGKDVEFKLFNYVALLSYDACYLFSGTILLRKLRVNTPVPLRKSAESTGRYCVGMLGGSAVLAALIVVFCFIMNLINSLLLKIPGTHSVLPSFLTTFLLSLKKSLMKLLSGTWKENEIPADITPAPTLSELPGEPVSEPVEQIPAEEAAEAFPWVVVIIVVLLVAVLIVFFLNSRRKAVLLTKDQPDEKKIKARSDILRSDDSGNREKVRKAYRSFLKYVKKHGRKITISDTTLEISSKTADFVDAESLQILRSIYIQARYNKEIEITDEMVTDARKALEKIVSV